jgi:GDPmannose 4,6-dehydratase
MTNALIFGITGQDGTYLADFLLKKGYTVFGTYRRTSHKAFERLEAFDILSNVNLIRADLHDHVSISRAIKESKPDEIYNLAAQSFVAASFEQPLYTSDITGVGALRIFEEARDLCPKSKIYQASSSEMFGNSSEIKNEDSRLLPMSPYGISKVYAHKTAQFYREAYGMFISSGILFNHESPFRGLEFVTRKITSSIALIKQKKLEKIHLGNIHAKRDWGFAGDYVKAMWLMLQQKTPDDFVIATGKSFSVIEFLEKAFSIADLGDWQNFVEIDEKCMRPKDIEYLLGDASKARSALDWKPELSFDDLVSLMVEKDLEFSTK